MTQAHTDMNASELGHGRPLDWIIGFVDKYIDVPMAIIGALFMGTLVWLVNADHGPLWASVAALKQAAYTFCFGGFVVKMCKNLATGIRGRGPALLAATLLPGSFAVTATLIVHNMRGTPEPFLSTVPTMIMAPLGFLGIAFFTRRKFDTAA